MASSASCCRQFQGEMGGLLILVVLIPVITHESRVSGTGSGGVFQPRE